MTAAPEQAKASQLNFNVNPTVGTGWSGYFDVNFSDQLNATLPASIFFTGGLGGSFFSPTNYSPVFPIGIIWEDLPSAIGIASPDLEALASAGGTWQDVLDFGSFELFPVEYDTFAESPQVSYRTFGGFIEFSPASVPGPMPAIGAAVAFGFSRQLRRRIGKGGRVAARASS